MKTDGCISGVVYVDWIASAMVDYTSEDASHYAIIMVGKIINYCSICGVTDMKMWFSQENQVCKNSGSGMEA